MKKIVRNSAECVGCHLCELACSFKHWDAFSSRLSYLRIKSDESLATNELVICRQCDDAPCMDVCPMNAISKDENTGAMKIDQDKCIMCKMCMNACPYKAIFAVEVPENRKMEVHMCDLCGGEPECVKVCYRGSIEYKDVDAGVRG